MKFCYKCIYHTHSSINGPTKVSKSEISRRNPATANGTPNAWVMAINNEGFDPRRLVAVASTRLPGS